MREKLSVLFTMAMQHHAFIQVEEIENEQWTMKQYSFLVFQFAVCFFLSSFHSIYFLKNQNEKWCTSQFASVHSFSFNWNWGKLFGTCIYVIYIYCRLLMGFSLAITHYSFLFIFISVYLFCSANIIYGVLFHLHQYCWRYISFECNRFMLWQWQRYQSINKLKQSEAK